MLIKILSTFSLAATLAITFPSAAQDKPIDGLSGVTWGSPMEAFGGDLVFLKNSGAGKCYSKKGEDIKFADVVPKAVEYCFYDNMFYGSLFIFSGTPAEMASVKKQLNDRYGQSENESIWGSDTQTKVGLGTEQNYGVLGFLNVPIFEKQQIASVALEDASLGNKDSLFMNSQLLLRPGIDDLGEMTVRKYLVAIKRKSLTDGSNPEFLGWSKESNRHTLRLKIIDDIFTLTFVHDLSQRSAGKHSVLMAPKLGDDEMDPIQFTMLLLGG